MSVEVATSYNFLSRVANYPLLNDTYTQANTYYLWAKNKNAYVASTLDMAETGLTKAATLATQPIVRRLNNETVTSLDKLACSQLDRLETICPAVQKPTKEIVEDCKVYYTQRVKPVVDRAVTPVKGAVQMGTDLVHSSTIVKSLQDNIKALSEEWQKALQAKTELPKDEKEETPNQDSQGLLESARQWAGHLRLSLEAASDVVYGRLSEDNQQRLTNAKTYADQMLNSLTKARHVSDLSEAFFVQSKETLHFVQDSVEKCVQYVTKFIPLSYTTSTTSPNQTETGQSNGTPQGHEDHSTNDVSERPETGSENDS